MNFDFSEIVPEELGDYGVYFKDDQLLESNTQKLSYSWGIDKQKLRTTYMQPGTAELLREIKRRLSSGQKLPTQDEALQIAYTGVKKHNDEYTHFGDEMHQAFKAYDTASEFALPTPKHQAYFEGFKYFRNQHQVKPILVEQFLVCPHCGLSSQIDNFSEVNGLNTVIDYKTGHQIGANTSYQLAILKHILEQLGYKVDRTWAVHIQEYVGYPIELCEPWENVEIRLQNAELKIKALRPRIYIRKFSGQKKEAPGSSEPQTSEDEQSQAVPVSQGRPSQQEALELLPTTAETTDELRARLDHTYLYPVGKPPREIDVELSPTELSTQTPRSKTPQEDPSENISSRTADFQPGNPFLEAELDPSFVRQVSHAKPQRPQAI